MAFGGEGWTGVRLQAAIEGALGERLHRRRATGVLVGHVHGLGMLLLGAGIQRVDDLIQQASGCLGRLGSAIPSGGRMG